jgi:O-antigen/teichoic acid export membrane protein
VAGVAAAARWAFLSGALSKLAPPLFAVALARILSPADFGLLAVAMVVIAFVTLFQDLGLKQALVQRKQATDPLTGAVFWAGAGLGVFWFVAVWVAAPWLADLYREPAVVPVLRTLGGLFLITPLGAVPEALLLRDLAFRRLFAVELLPSVVPGAAAVVLGLAGLGVWALVWGTLAGAVCRTAALWAIAGWRPGLPPRAAEWRRLARFGGWLSLEALLGWTITYADQAFAGRFLGTAPVGFYRMGFSLALFPATGVSQVLSRVLFPAFSRIQDDLAAVRAGYAQCMRILALLTVPLGTALLAYADPAVPFVLGARWAPTVAVVQLLAGVGVLSSLVAVAPPLYRALGRVDIMPKFFAVRAVVSVPLYWYAARQGLLALAATQLGLALCFAPANLWVAARVFRVPIRAVGGFVGVPVGLAGAAWAVAHLAFHFRGEASGPHLWPVEAALFAVSYGLGLRFLARRRYDELMGMVRRVMGVAPEASGT